MKIAVILGSTRKGRSGERVAKLVVNQASAVSGWQVELLDLAELKLPMYEEATMPSMMNGVFEDASVKLWSDKIAEADAFIFVTAEYNHSIPAPLKNAIDWLFSEWDNKAGGIVSYSNSLYGGARATEHLRNILNEMGIAVVKTATSIGTVGTVVSEDGTTEAEGLLRTLSKELELIDLWGRALTTIRTQ
jgi:NAD(P)H-dependent FMN reductase